MVKKPAQQTPLKPSTRLPFVDNPQPGLLVHVEGWSRGAVFRFVRTVGKTHHLVTPKTRRAFQTTRRLYHTRRLDWTFSEWLAEKKGLL